MWNSPDALTNTLNSIPVGKDGLPVQARFIDLHTTHVGEDEIHHEIPSHMIKAEKSAHFGYTINWRHDKRRGQVNTHFSHISIKDLKKALIKAGTYDAFMEAMK